MNKRFCVPIGILLLALGLIHGFAAPNLPPADPANGGPPLDGFRGIGTMFVKNNRLDQLGWTEQQTAAFVEGIRAALAGKGYPLNEAARLVGSDMMRRVQQLENMQKQVVPDGFDQPGKLETYLKETKKRWRMQESDSGLLYSIKRVGHGERPTPTDAILVTFVGTVANEPRPLAEISGKNVRIKVSDLLPGLREGVQMMAVGSEAIFVLKPDLSFGASDWPVGVGPRVPLTFVVTLHEVIGAAK